MKNLGTKILGTAVAATLSGCIICPEPGEFPKPEELVAIPHHPVVMLLSGGVYKHQPVLRDGKLSGIEITKEGFLSGKVGTQKLIAPYGAEAVGIRRQPGILFADDYWVGYTQDGKRRTDQHGVGWDAKSSSLKGQFEYQTKEEKFVRMKR